MITIEQFINKIKWDKRENPNEYSLFYLDRVSKKLVEIKYNDIERLDDGFVIIMMGAEEINIPLHRIRKVKKNGKTVWER